MKLAHKCLDTDFMAIILDSALWVNCGPCTCDLVYVLLCTNYKAIVGKQKLKKTKTAVEKKIVAHPFIFQTFSSYHTIGNIWTKADNFCNINSWEH